MGSKFRISLRKVIPIFVTIACVAGFFAIRAFSSRDVSAAQQLIASFRRGDGSEDSVYPPHLGPLDSWCLSINTYTHDVPSRTIADLYSRACRKLVELYKDEVKTYSWSDEEGWPRIATVVQFKIDDKPRDVLIVRAYQNNDNDNFTFEYRDGVFDTSNKKLLSSWELPNGLLRNGAR